MNTNLDIGRLVADASKRLGIDFRATASEALVETMRRAFGSVPYAINEARMSADMLGYPLAPEVILSAKSTPELIGISIRDQEKLHMPIKCAFLVGYRVALAMSCRDRCLDIRSSEYIACAFYLLAYAIRLQQPVG